MKLHLILLTTLFQLTSGFTVTIKGEFTEEPCSGEEYPEFESCVLQGVAIDPNLTGVFNDNFDGGFYMNRGSERKLQTTNPCGACTGDEPKGHFCFTYCNDPGSRRRVSEDGITDTAVFEDGTYEGNSEATDIAKVIIKCLVGVSTGDPCLPDTANMKLSVTL
jgi:hypothetical protein